MNVRIQVLNTEHGEGLLPGAEGTLKTGMGSSILRTLLCFQKDSWLPQEVPAHLFMGVPRDVRVDVGHSLTHASPSKKKLKLE